VIAHKTEKHFGSAVPRKIAYYPRM